MVKKIDYRKLAKAAALAADEKKADEILVLDVRKESDIADYLVIAGAGSSPQMGAIADSVEVAMRDAGVRMLHREGKSRDRWIALDFGGVVVHVFLNSARDFYRLENLWENAKPVKWE